MHASGSRAGGEAGGRGRGQLGSACVAESTTCVRAPRACALRDCCNTREGVQPEQQPHERHRVRYGVKEHRGIRGSLLTAEVRLYTPILICVSRLSCAGLGPIVVLIGVCAR